MKSMWVGAVAIAVLVLAACEEDETTNPTTASSSRASSSASTSASTSASSAASTGAGGTGGSTGGAGGATGGNGGTGGISGTGGNGGAAMCNPPMPGVGGGSGVGGAGGGGSQPTFAINEIDSSNDWVEFYNFGNAAVDISCWYFSDNEPQTSGHTYQFPPGTIVPAGAFIVREQNVDFTFGLANGGDSIILFDPSNNIVEQTTWPSNGAVPSWGRFPDGTGAFGTRSAATQGTANQQ